MNACQIFCYGCGMIGHGLEDCEVVHESIKDLSDDEMPFSLALKTKSNMVGKECLSLRLSSRKFTKQCLYVGKERAKS